MAPPLAGVKVPDLSRTGPGPYRTMPLADLGAEVIKVTHPGTGIKLSETPGEIRDFAPLPGQHTDDILAALGYTGADITKLREAGALG